mgnify:FL=1
MGVVADLRSGAKTQLDAVKAANPTAVLQTYSVRPASVGSTPCAWVDEARLDLRHDSGTRQWSGEVDVWLVDAGGMDSAESQDRLDALAALVIDRFSDTPHAFGANTVSEPMRVRSGAVDINGIIHPATIVTVGRFVFQEGR